MAENSNIEWCHHTLNLWWGCEKVSEACKYCYAETLARRFAPGHWGKHAPRRMASARTRMEPLKWNERAKKRARRERVFVNSMSDIAERLPAGHPQRDELHEAREHLWWLVEQCPQLDFLLLTKRPENLPTLAPFAPNRVRIRYRNLWIGTTVETQERAAERLPHLLRAPAAVRFVSAEPLLGPLAISHWLGGMLLETRDGRWLRRGFVCESVLAHEGGAWRDGIDWVIAGGESGAHARPTSPAWIDALRGQCEEAGVPYFFKQWGAWCPDNAVSSATRKLARDTCVLDGATMVKVGAKAAGAKLKLGRWRTFRELPRQARLFAA